MVRPLFKVNIKHPDIVPVDRLLEHYSDFQKGYQGWYSSQSINNMAVCFQIDHPALNPPH